MRFYLAITLLALSKMAVAAVPDEANSLAVEQSEPYQQVCEAALYSKEAAKKTAIELDIGRRELNRIRCNELSVMDFANLNSKQPEDWAIATVQ